MLIIVERVLKSLNLIKNQHVETENHSIDTLSSDLNEVLALLSDDCSNENLHTLRLKLKTIKALCILYDHHLNSPDPKLKIFEPFKKLFKHAGSLRDNHQLEKHLRHYFSDENKWIEDLHELLAAERHQLKDKFINKIDNYQTEEANESLNILANYIEPDTKKNRLADALKAFSNDKLNIEEELLRGPDKDQLHHIRARLKHVLLLSKLFHKPLPPTITLEHIDHLQEELGKLHDYELLCKFVTKHINENERDQHLTHRVLNLNVFIEKLRVDCLKKLTLLANNSHL
ncbi:hypothetical protein C3K47_06225 [Solitalea longa]|uniref:CHAD domain-containing protein n=1 Tax=Solitalea longa TaxID=2079460 RepID=A0A2S5A496_9SPHI|nr:CHAD domain-containing protein [Solitalea longa]POY37356.1 hypothetical protein C3K47_06225 [Solitalea longa]